MCRPANRCSNHFSSSTKCCTSSTFSAPSGHRRKQAVNETPFTRSKIGDSNKVFTIVTFTPKSSMWWMTHAIYNVKDWPCLPGLQHNNFYSRIQYVASMWSTQLNSRDGCSLEFRINMVWLTENMFGCLLAFISRFLKIVGQFKHLHT